MSLARMMQMAAAGSAGAGPEPSGWTDPDLGNASYDSVSFSVAGQDSAPRKVFFKPDGTKMYVAGSTGRNVYEYDLSTAWDITSATFLQSFSVSTEETDLRGLYFKSDGTEMYIIGSGGDDVNQYSLSTAWDVSTASFLQAFSVSGQEISPQGIFFRADGIKMYFVGISGDDVNEYTLSTAWDISTASYVQSFSVLSEAPFVTDVVFNPDGSKMWITGQNSDAIIQYSLSTVWNISTASYDAISFSVNAQEAAPQGFIFKPDGAKMYVVGTITDTIYQYSTAAAAPAEWTDPDLANASYDSVSFSVATQASLPFATKFNDDGTKMFVVDNTTDSLYEYALSTAYDVSTASYSSVSFSVTSQDTVPVSVFFKPDGTKMYVSGINNDAIYQYSLSTAFDLSTASYDSVSFSVASQDALPYGAFFKPDGTKFYIVGLGSDTVHQYTMSSAWDLSTASYDSVSFSVTTQASLPAALFFNPDGDKMWISDLGIETIFQYSLSTPWVVSSASYDSVSFDASAQIGSGNAVDVIFKPDGSKMYITDNISRTIYQYSTA